jgi:6-phosphogluconolactonase (cycloisomerase 2 family)
MKLRKFGQAVLATVVGVGLSFGLTSCVQSHTIGYLFVTGHQYNQVSSYKIDNNTGNLTLVAGSPFGTNGTNPVDALVTSGGRFLYVLNAGCADPSVYPSAKYPCASGQAPVASNISVFTIGGGGVISFQQSYTSVGVNSVSITSDTGGNFLYVLDQNVPNASTTPAQYLADGDVSVFSLDSVTGRLSLIQNQQVNDTTGAPLTFFPVGQEPVWFTLYSSYLFTIDRDAGQATRPTYVTSYAAPSTGQLTATQNSEFQTGATDLSYIYGKGSYLYLLDAGDPSQSGNASLYNGSILTYTASNGALAPVTGGAQTQASLGYINAVNPNLIVVENAGKFVYVANQGLNNGLSSPASTIASYQIISNGTLTAVGGVNGGSQNSYSGSGPRCLLEDPSNQFLFAANYNDSTVSGLVINTEAGVLSPLQKKSTFAAPGNPTWCVASGTTF